MDENNNISKEQILNEILELKKKAYSDSLIGKIIKEKYNISIKELFNKKLSKILLENGYKEEYPEELVSYFKRINKLVKHLDQNKKDIYAKRTLERLESEIYRLIEYYKSIGKLNKSFKYSRDITKMFSS